MAAALSTTTNKIIGARSVTLDRDTNISASGVALTLTPATGHLRKLHMVTVKYSANASVTVLITLNSGAGAGWDTVIGSIVLSAATDGVWIPDGDIFIDEGDQLDVLAPLLTAETASLAIYSERL